MSLIARICYNLLLVCLIQYIYILYDTGGALLEEKYCNASMPLSLLNLIIPFNAVYMLLLTSMESPYLF